MARFPIPPRQRGSFRALGELPEELFLTLRKALAEAPLNPNAAAVAFHVAESVRNAPAETIEGIVEAVLSLATFAGRRVTDAQDFVEEIDISPLQLPEEGGNVVRQRLKDLLSLESVWLIGRALDLVSAETHLMLTGRIVTDLRPIYRGEEPEGLEPIAGMVMHSLVLEYLEGTESKAFRLSVDVIDIASLQAALRRAEAKGKALTKMMLAQGMRNATLRGPDDE